MKLQNNNFKYEFVNKSSVSSNYVEAFANNNFNSNASLQALNSEYSWLSVNFVGDSISNTILIFCFIWFFIVALVSFFNVGLSSLLFLLEAGLFTPIATMAAINSIPLSTVFYFLNAITMEAVVGVIIALSYSKDWAHKDFTKYEVLEGKFLKF